MKMPEVREALLGLKNLFKAFPDDLLLSLELEVSSKALVVLNGLNMHLAHNIDYKMFKDAKKRMGEIIDLRFRLETIKSLLEVVGREKELCGILDEYDANMETFYQGRPALKKVTVRFDDFKQAVADHIPKGWWNNHLSGKKSFWL